MRPVRRFLVTGGAGFIGSHIATALVERGDRVRVLDDLSTGGRENLAHLTIGPEGSGAPVELMVGDVEDRALVTRACRGVEGVFHEAALVSVPQSLEEPGRCYRTNVAATLGLLEAARGEGARGFVLAASSAAYGDEPTLPKEEAMAPRPLSPYASSKLAGEDLLAVWGRAHGLRTVALRYFNVFGPRQADDSPYSGVIALFVRRLLAGEPITLHGGGEQTRDFVYVADVVAANLAAMDAELEPGTVLNVGTGERVSIRRLHLLLAEIVGSSAAPESGPERPGDVPHSQASIEKIRRVLGWEPRTGLREGLEQTVSWYRQRAAATR